MPEHARFLDADQARKLREDFGSPIFVYDKKTLHAAGTEMLGFKAPFGLKVRYAMKANSNLAILKFFDSMEIHIDASSEFEAERAIMAGIDPSKILLTSQEVPKNVKGVVDTGIEYNATSLRQLQKYGEAFPGGEVSVRINPGEMGEDSSGHDHTKVNGDDAGFGISTKDLTNAKEIISTYGLKVIRVHTHIGSGSDPETWANAAKVSANFLKEFSDATILNLGGGFKVGRMPGEESANIADISERVSKILEDFYTETGRKIALEVEPGTFLTANAGAILATIQDVERDVNKILKLDCGMSEIIRPALYGAEHDMEVITDTDRPEEYEEAIVIGHSCEHADVLAKTRKMLKAQIDDILVIYGAGAYCSSMSTKNYCSFPDVAEVMIGFDGKARLIKKRQTIQQMIQNELIDSEENPS